MNETRLVKISKFLSKHLRHDPGGLGLTLAPGGWVSVADLLAACARHRLALSRAELDQVVAQNSKQRFSFDALDSSGAAVVFGRLLTARATTGRMKQTHLFPFALTIWKDAPCLRDPYGRCPRLFFLS